ncbi:MULTISPECIES: hypothetical protein [Clostridium]|uniref:Uncharacterized protein n=1 Tax=Clostridium paridis TaxID=2803863 RepID=A0A937FJ69_9CLOT|nr:MULTISPECIES: hypothetical protein [Clostridium]MBL4933217.1 hypothetical protein [Clostridium paridis]MDD7794354.1 hypothetical protein [Clostridium sp. 'White wine YQ']
MNPKEKIPFKKIITNLIFFDVTFIFTSLILRKSLANVNWSIMLFGSAAYVLTALYLNSKAPKKE